MNIQNLAAYDPFADTGEARKQQEGYIRKFFFYFKIKGNLE